MNLVLQMMNGVALAGLAEGLALADRAGLQQKDVMEVLGLTQLACPMLVDKGKGNFNVSIDASPKNMKSKNIRVVTSYVLFITPPKTKCN